jgi:hypothetical protein
LTAAPGLVTAPEGDFAHPGSNRAPVVTTATVIGQRLSSCRPRATRRCRPPLGSATCRPRWAAFA